MTNIRNEGSRNGRNNWISEPFLPRFSVKMQLKLVRQSGVLKVERRGQKLQERKRGGGDNFRAVSRLFPSMGVV